MWESGGFLGLDLDEGRKKGKKGNMGDKGLFWDVCVFGGGILRVWGRGRVFRDRIIMFLYLFFLWHDWILGDCFVLVVLSGEGEKGVGVPLGCLFWIY